MLRLSVRLSSGNAAIGPHCGVDVEQELSDKRLFREVTEIARLNRSLQLIVTFSLLLDHTKLSLNTTRTIKNQTSKTANCTIDGMTA